MTSEKQKVHFTDLNIINATNPVTVNVIGAGGTGSKVMTALMEMNHSLIKLGHAGLDVRLWDDDIITEANLGRQRFADCEVGLYKSVAIINRVNRWSGTNWKAYTDKFQFDSLGNLPKNASAIITISCVDTVQSRFEIAEILQNKKKEKGFLNSPRYWLDFGNSQYTGQAILSTIGTIKQPKSEKYETVESLPCITDEFNELLRAAELDVNTPSCSLEEALGKQDLYINATLVQLGSSLLWNLFRNGLTSYRGFFLNLKDFRSQPIPV